ncbi:hypothetical protein Tco_1181178 [Tanacetum coccineum]
MQMILRALVVLPRFTFSCHIHSYHYNNMPPKRTSAATARVVAAARAVVPAALMKTAAIEQLIEARVSAVLSNHETLRNRTNGHGDGSHNSET